MERNRNNSEDSGNRDDRFDESEFDANGSRPDETPEFSYDDDGHNGDAAAPIGPEWFDPRWLRANGAEKNDEGELVQVGSPVLVLVTEPAETAPAGQKLDQTMREFGMLAWSRKRAAPALTLVEQLAASERARREWLERNPFAEFWAMTARTASRGRRGAPRRP